MPLDNGRQRHVLYLIDELKVKGGSEKHLYDLAVGLSERGHRVSAFTFAEGAFAETLKSQPCLHYQCLQAEKIYNPAGIRAIAHLVSYIRKSEVDLIQSFHTASDIVAPIAARLSQRRVIVVSSRRDLGYTKALRHLLAQRILNPFVDGILANSEAVKRAVVEQERERQEKIAVIRNGINIQIFSRCKHQREDQRNKLGLGPNDIAIGSVGNARPVKGYHVLVEAAAKVFRTRKDCVFFHVGEGEELSALRRRCAEWGIGSSFRFLGKLDDIPAFLPALDIYAQPSFSEGFSNAVLEAMAAGLPVIATSVGGNTEIVEDGVSGLLYRPDDSEKLSKLILMLSQNAQQRMSFGKNGFEKVCKKHSINLMLNQYIDYYNSMDGNLYA